MGYHKGSIRITNTITCIMRGLNNRIGESFKGFLKGVHKGSVVGF